MKLHTRDAGPEFGKQYFFWCPGCKQAHVFHVGGNAKIRPQWNFDGNMESPTFTPSLRMFYTNPETKKEITTCHLILTAGQIQFQGDCQHDLKGKTIPMEDFPTGYGLPEQTHERLDVDCVRSFDSPLYPLPCRRPRQNLHGSGLGRDQRNPGAARDVCTLRLS